LKSQIKISNVAGVGDECKTLIDRRCTKGVNTPNNVSPSMKSSDKRAQTKVQPTLIHLGIAVLWHHAFINLQKMLHLHWSLAALK